MRVLRSSLLALSLAAVGLATVADAQDGEASPEQSAPETTSGMAAQAEAIQARGEALAARLQGLLDEARQEGDIIKVTCLNDKLTQSNANLRSVKRRVEALKDAVELNERDTADHEFTVLSVLAQKFDTLDREARQCVGQDMFEPGAAQVTSAVDSTIVPTDVDPTTAQPSPTLAPSVSVPPPASGTM